MSNTPPSERARPDEAAPVDDSEANRRLHEEARRHARRHPLLDPLPQYGDDLESLIPAHILRELKERDGQ